MDHCASRKKRDIDMFGKGRVSEPSVLIALMGVLLPRLAAKHRRRQVFPAPTGPPIPIINRGAFIENGRPSHSLQPTDAKLLLCSGLIAIRSCVGAQ